MQKEKWFITVPGSNSIRITSSGKNKFQQEFINSGLDIHSIKTKTQHLNARDIIFHKKINRLYRDNVNSQTVKRIFEGWLDN